MRTITVLFSLLCLYQISTSDGKQQKCDLRGQWRNELGSNMTVESMNNAGFFRGSYMTAVTTQNEMVVKVSPLSGFLNINGKSTVFGFLVKWSFVESVTSWVGQCFVDSNGVEHLETMWLLRGKAQSAGDDWAQTRVGKNVFHRIQ